MGLQSISLHDVEALIVPAQRYEANDRHSAFSTLTLTVGDDASRTEIKLFFKDATPPDYAFALARAMNDVPAPALEETTT